MSDKPNRETYLALALSGTLTGALIETFGEIAKELRRYAGSDFDKRLDALETRAIRSVENAPFDGVPESDQLRLVEQARSVVAAMFKDARHAS